MVIQYINKSAIIVKHYTTDINNEKSNFRFSFNPGRIY